MRRLGRIALGVALLGLAAFAFVSVDRCGPWEASAPGVTRLARGHGPLFVGAARKALSVPYPVTIAGYGPLRSASSSQSPLEARAVVVEVGGQRFALVQLDVLLISDRLAAAVQRAVNYPVWVVATHTHSGPGAFDARLAAELSALGRVREDVCVALEQAGTDALHEAEKHLAAATLELSHTGIDEWLRPRTGEGADGRLTRARFVGVDGKAMAEWLILAAHPTLLPQSTSALDADYPGLLDVDSGPVRLTMQGAAGNASTLVETAPAFVSNLEGKLATLPTDSTTTELDLSFAESALALARPVAPKQIPAIFRPVVENALCDGSSHAVSLSRLVLGPLTLLAVPVEPSYPAGQLLESSGQATRVVSLVNGYAGYVEPVAVAERGEGEAVREYFGAGFITQLLAAAEVAAAASAH